MKTTTHIIFNSSGLKRGFTALILFVFLLIGFTSCGQTTATNKEISVIKTEERAAQRIYQKMTSEICNCTTTTMRDNRPSTTMDSCYKVSLDKNTDTLKALGFDPASSVGQNKLVNELKFTRCWDLYTAIEKEMEAEKAKKLLFTGVISSQKQLPNGEVEIVMSDVKTKANKVFVSKFFLEDPAKTNKNMVSYEMTVEYEVRRNPRTKKEEFYIKDDSQQGTFLIQEVGN